MMRDAGFDGLPLPQPDAAASSRCTAADSSECRRLPRGWRRRGAAQPQHRAPRRAARRCCAALDGRVARDVETSTGARCGVRARGERRPPRAAAGDDAPADAAISRHAARRCSRMMAGDAGRRRRAPAASGRAATPRSRSASAKLLQLRAARTSRRSSRALDRRRRRRTALAPARARPFGWRRRAAAPLGAQRRRVPDRGGPRPRRPAPSSRSSSAASTSCARTPTAPRRASAARRARRARRSARDEPARRRAGCSQIQRVLVRHGLDEFVRATHLYRPLRFLVLPVARRPGSSAARGATRGERLRLALEELGPIFVKFGQALSTRRDLLPADIADELAKLQDRVPPFPAPRRVATIEARARPARSARCSASFDDDAARRRLDRAGARRDAQERPRRSSSRSCGPACTSHRARPRGAGRARARSRDDTGPERRRLRPRRGRRRIRQDHHRRARPACARPATPRS